MLVVIFPSLESSRVSGLGVSMRNSMNRINPSKLLHSKWTAVNPTKKEKHFLVTEVEFDEEGEVIQCIIEAVFSNRSMPIDWTELKNEAVWQQGWK